MPSVGPGRRVGDLPPSPWDSLSLASTGREGEPAVMVEYCIRCGRQAPPVDSSAYMAWEVTAADDLVSASTAPTRRSAPTATPSRSPTTTSGSPPETTAAPAPGRPGLLRVAGRAGPQQRAERRTRPLPHASRRAAAGGLPRRYSQRRPAPNDSPGAASAGPLAVGSSAAGCSAAARSAPRAPR
jgi:hypothetical protein